MYPSMDIRIEIVVYIIVANMCDYQKYVFMRAYVKYTF